MSGKSKKSGLGNALMKERNRAKMSRHRRKGGKHSTADGDGEDVLDRRARKYDSIIERNDLQEFMAVADMANRDFTAERGDTVTIVVDNAPQVYELDSDQFSLVLRDTRKSQRVAHDLNLPMPRRPPWRAEMSRKELNESEKAAFLNWRRSLAKKEQELDYVVTPYEKNLEMWRQLWRTVEQSHVVVQIVDVRNPLAFHSEDLETYVKEIDRKKRNILVLNKADLLSKKQRFKWAQYLNGKGIHHMFFSARAEQEHLDEQEDDPMSIDDIDFESYVNPSVDDVTHIFNREQLLIHFRGLANQLLTHDEMQQEIDPNNYYKQRRIVIGMVGYPNVGKSSVINVLCGRKRVAVAATPGKTKYIQTIPIGEHMVLCDCPGLVFPSVATTKQDMVVDGIIPIDQMRDYRPPVALLCSRIPMRTFELLYGIRFEEKMRNPRRRNEPLTVDELLSAFARTKGMMAQKGVPNYHAAARILLKDYVNGKLLYCHPPPDHDEQEEQQQQQHQHRQGKEEHAMEEEEEEQILDHEEALEDDEEYFTEDEDDDNAEDDEAREKDREHTDEYDVDYLNDYDSGKPKLDETKQLTASQKSFNEENVHSDLLREREMRKHNTMDLSQPDNNHKINDLYDESEHIAAGVAPTAETSGFATKGVNVDLIQKLSNISNRDQIIEKARQKGDLTMEERRKLKMLKRRQVYLKKLG